MKTASCCALSIKERSRTLPFVTKRDEENKQYWAPANDLTIDMVNKYEKDFNQNTYFDA
jgi:hypothetical protein